MELPPSPLSLVAKKAHIVYAGADGRDVGS